MNENLKYKKGITSFSCILTTLILFAILIPISGTEVLAQEFSDAITVTTDKTTYQDGEIIIVSGSVKDRLPGYDVTVQVFAANGNLVTTQQLSVSDENTFGIDMTGGGPLWRSAGTYTIKVFYGTETRIAETTFTFEPFVDPCRFIRDCGFFEDGSSIEYEIEGGKIISITPNIQAKALIVNIESTDDGEVTFTLPRSVIDARLGPDGINGEDEIFLIRVDGSDADFDETKTSESRILTIPFKDGTTQIEIIGTWIIPEFGAVAIIILAVSIVSIITISARSKLSIQ